MREKLAELLGADVQWADDCIGADAERRRRSCSRASCCCSRTSASTRARRRTTPRSPRELRKLADFYVNDAFGACHRAHASIDALPRLFPKENTAGGLLLAKELEFLQKVTNIAERPFVALMGGAKIAGKIEPLEALVKLADKVLIGGGMANTFLAAQRRADGRLARRHGLDRSRAADHGGRARAPRSCCRSTSSSPTRSTTRRRSRRRRRQRRLHRRRRRPSTSARRRSALTRPSCRTRRRSSGTARWACSRRSSSRKARWPWPAPSRTPTAITVVGGGESVEAVKASGFADTHHPHLHRRRRVAGVHLRRGVAGGGGTAGTMTVTVDGPSAPGPHALHRYVQLTQSWPRKSRSSSPLKRPRTRSCASCTRSARSGSTPRRSRTTSSSTAAASCARKGALLRVRKFGRYALATYKGPMAFEGGVKTREEVQTGVESFELAIQLFDSLGYKPVFRYQKFREVWRVREVEVVLDRTPIGDYFEIEGPLDVIRAVAEELGMNMDARASARATPISTASTAARARDLPREHGLPAGAVAHCRMKGDDPRRGLRHAPASDHATRCRSRWCRCATGR